MSLELVTKLHDQIGRSKQRTILKCLYPFNEYANLHIQNDWHKQVEIIINIAQMNPNILESIVFQGEGSTPFVKLQDENYIIGLKYGNDIAALPHELTHILHIVNHQTISEQMKSLYTLSNEERYDFRRYTEFIAFLGEFIILDNMNLNRVIRKSPKKKLFDNGLGFYHEFAYSAASIVYKNMKKSIKYPEVVRADLNQVNTWCMQNLSVEDWRKAEKLRNNYLQLR